MDEVKIIKKEHGTIAVSFQYDKSIVEAIHLIPTRRWDPEKKMWFFQDTPYIKQKILQVFSGYTITEVNPFINSKECVALLKELQSLKYSRKTIKAYLYYNQEFFSFCNKSFDKIERQDIVDFLSHLAENHNYNVASLNIAISALKFFYGKILQKPIIIDKKRPKKEVQPLDIGNTNVLRHG